MPCDNSFIIGGRIPFRNRFNYNSFPFNSLLYTVTPIIKTPSRSSQKANKNHPLRVKPLSLTPRTSIHLSGQRLRQAPEVNQTHIYRKEYKHFLRCFHYGKRNLRKVKVGSPEFLTHLPNPTPPSSFAHSVEICFTMSSVTTAHLCADQSHEAGWKPQRIRICILYGQKE